MNDLNHILILLISIFILFMNNGYSVSRVLSKFKKNIGLIIICVILILYIYSTVKMKEKERNRP